MKKALILFLAGLFFSSFSLTASAQEMNACTGSNCDEEKEESSESEEQYKTAKSRMGCLWRMGTPFSFQTRAI